jgi:DNA-binding SARP family transcriptional activator
MRPAARDGALGGLDDVSFTGRARRRNAEQEVPSPSAEAPDRPQPVRIRTLGGFELEVEGEAVHFGRKVPRRTLDLLKCIVALGAGGASRDVLASALWPDSEGDAARTALEVTLHRLRKVLRHKGAAQLSNGVVHLEPSAVWIDAVAFEELADRANGEHGAVNLDAASRALALYGGPFLQNHEETAWLLPRRDRLRSRYVRLAMRAAQQCDRAGDTGQAAEIYAATLEAEPLIEDLYRRLMLCLARQGRRAEAFDTYRRCRNMLALMFEAAPSQETEAAYASIRRGA